MTSFQSMKENMDNSDYSLKWNNFTTNLTCGFISHLTDNELVDVTLAVQGKLLQAHKLVLSVCSPYFKEIFKVNPCTHPVVVLKGMGYAQIEALLQFMYRGEVNISHNDLSSFLKVAEELKIKGLAGDQNRSSSSDSQNERNVTTPCLETVEVDSDKATCSNLNANTIEKIKIKLSDSENAGKRTREPTTRSRSLTPKRSRASPPPLKEIEGAHFIQAKSEPEEFELQGQPYFLDDPLEQYLEAQQDEKGGFRRDETGGEFHEDEPSNSLTSAVHSQAGAVSQELNDGSANRLLLLHGFVYKVNKKVGNRLYWRCKGYHLHKCKARCVTHDSLVLQLSGIHTHNYEESISSSYFLVSGKKFQCEF